MLKLLPYIELNELLQLLTRMIILNDPGPYVDKLRSLLQQRRLFSIELLKIERIPLSIDSLIEVL